MPEGLAPEIKRTGLGISIEHDRLIALQAGISPEGVSIEKVEECQLPANSVSNGRIIDYQAISKSYIKLKKSAKLSAVAASVNLPMNLCTLKRFDMPENYFSSDREALGWELDQHLIGPPEDYRVSSMQAGKGERWENHIAVAARKALVDGRAGLLLNFGLSVVAVEPDILSLYNGFTLAFGELSGKLLFFVDISYPCCSFALSKDGVFLPGGVLQSPEEILTKNAENVAPDIAFTLMTAFDTNFSLDGYSMTDNRPDYIVIGGAFADTGFIEILGKAMGIPLFKSDPLKTGNIASKVKKAKIGWQKYIKPLALAVRI